MSGICGFVGTTGVIDQCRETIDRMRRPLGDPGVHPTTIIARSCGAIAAEPGVRAAVAYESDGLLCAVEGDVRWRDPALASLASEHGGGAALAQAYRDAGSRCLEGMSGPFAAAALDSAKASGFIAIDRLGTRTLCYACPPGGFVFASNITSVVAHPAVDRSLSRQAIFDYLYCHVIPSPGTIYTSVRKLQPGECVTFRDGSVHAQFYWRLQYRDDGGQAPELLGERLRSAIRASVARSIDGAEDPGAFLSGGTDSSTVVAMLTDLKGEPVRTYSLGFAWEGFDEMNYARIAARHVGAQAHEYYVSPQDIVDAIPVITRAYDEPFG